MIDRAVLALEGIRPLLALVGALTVVRALLVVGQAVGIACAVVALWEGAQLSDAVIWIAFFAVCFVLRRVVESAEEDRVERFASDTARTLRSRLLESLYALGPAALVRHGSAELVDAALEGVENVESYLLIIIPKMAAVVIIPLVLLIAIFPLDWVSGVIALVCFPFVILYMGMIGYTAKDDAARRHGEFVRMSNHFVDSLRGIDVLRSFGLSHGHGERIFAASERFREMTMKTLRIATLSSAVLDLFATLALAAVAIMLGFRLAEGTLAFFPALCVLVLVPEYFRPLREFASDYHASLDGKTSLAAIGALIEEGSGAAADSHSDSAVGRGKLEDDALGDSAVPERDEERARTPQALSVPAVVKDAPASGACTDRVGPSSPPCLACADVSFSYGEDASYALSDVSFDTQDAHRIAVIGKSGSGKSTLVRLIGGFARPSAGSFAVDGMPVDTLACDSWRRRVAYIPQDPYIFHGTLRENVVFYTPQADDAAVARALEAAGLDELVRELPSGVDTVIGSGGRAVSGGQAQRIALARAFLDDARDVLVLDEPTAHLDIETEYELKQRMLPLFEGRLVVFATHRLHWLDDMERVIVLDRGRIVWDGAPDALADAGVLDGEGGVPR